MGRRLLRAPGSKWPIFSCGQDVYSYFYPKFSGLKKEVFRCALPDVKNRVVRELKISERNLTSSLVHPREAFRDAVRESAAAVIFAHNHPSGGPQPKPKRYPDNGKARSCR